MISERDVASIYENQTAARRSFTLTTEPAPRI